ncbi:hypothetical protein EDB92DRAFT_111668 [Lactarius akahatsu]|uniref:F-box domain-containing protein n=1 Tax=Lactarius akahatsu TaxID=416441 RepID=A0AAD4LLC2_9AGAM|nr:hypothetical protein EDB92DRAFT_111668 [Lactarius akahatsu]
MPTPRQTLIHELVQEFSMHLRSLGSNDRRNAAFRWIMPSLQSVSGTSHHQAHDCDDGATIWLKDTVPLDPAWKRRAQCSYKLLIDKLSAYPEGLELSHEPATINLLVIMFVFHEKLSRLEDALHARRRAGRRRTWCGRASNRSKKKKKSGRCPMYCRRLCPNTVVQSFIGGYIRGLVSSDSPSTVPLKHTRLPSRGSPGSTSSLDLSPPPRSPISERPGYSVLYTTVNTLNDDILLRTFSYFRLGEEDAWNERLGWCKLSHTCRRWRHLVYSSAFHLGMHILCTNGTPIVDTLDHLPPVPLFVNYQYEAATPSRKDELGIHHALRLRDRVRRIVLHFPPSAMHQFLMLMDGPFPILERLSLSFPADKMTGLILPNTFLAPNLRHLTLIGVGLPKGLSSLSSTAFLVTLSLTNIRASGYFLPSQLVARLQFLPQLEGLSIGFSIPIPRPAAERVLLGKRRTPFTLPKLKNLTFQGVSAYLERFVSQIKAPLLERLDITLFGQIAFALPQLSHLTNMTKRLELPKAEVCFGRDEVSIVLDHHVSRRYGRNGHFILRVMCKNLDWQIDCAAQVCGALMPVLSGVEKLTLGFHKETMPTKWQNGEIDGTTWHELLRSFIGVKELHICGALSEELSRALEPVHGGACK